MENNNNKLMLEMLSPNVTKILPIDLSLFNLYHYNNFHITPHENGIFEFQLQDYRLYTESKILEVMNEAFNVYKDHIYNVDVTGFKNNNEQPSKVGSTRFCTMHYGFAKWLTSIIKHSSTVDVIRDTAGNWYEMVNVSQYFRFMRYQAGGEHFPHYDSDFEYKYNGAVTKYSVVVYFTRCKSGEIAFCNDNRNIYDGRKAQTDWDRQATNEEIYKKFLPEPLKIVAFPHTLCHTVLPFTDEGKTRIICRGDILFKKV